MNSSALMIVLRLVHIITGAAWFGSALMLMLFVIPVALRNGVEGSRFIQRLVERGLVRWIASVSGAAVLAGFGLYAHDSKIRGAGWSGTPTGMVLGIGGALGFVAALISVAYVGRAAKQLAKLGDRIGSDEAAPARILAEKQLANGGRIAGLLLILSTTAMAVARYL
jgi:uncharacterized membrane protein